MFGRRRCLPSVFDVLSDILSSRGSLAFLFKKVCVCVEEKFEYRNTITSDHIN